MLLAGAKLHIISVQTKHLHRKKLFLVQKSHFQTISTAIYANNALQQPLNTTVAEHRTHSPRPNKQETASNAQNDNTLRLIFAPC